MESTAAPNNVGKVRRFARSLARIYYPSIEITGRERIPSTGPVLFVANHPNSMLDPALVGLASGRPVHFLAKAPFFDIPLFGALLRALGMIPAYRGRDDASQVTRNIESLDAAAQWLVRNEVVGIFPEGKSHDLIRVEQVRSGAARMAMLALKQNTTALVIPLGLNYECKDQFRSAAWIRVGTPIDPAALLRDHQGEERKAMRALTIEIDRGLKSVVVHLDHERWTPLLPDLEVLLPPAPEFAKQPAAPLCQRKRIADAINYFMTVDQPRAEAVASSIERYHENLASEGLNIRSAVIQHQGRPLVLTLLGRGLWLTISFVPAVAGMLHHLVPFALTRALVQWLKHPGRATVASNQLLLGLPFYLLWYGLVWWLLARWTTAWIATLWILVMPFAGLQALAFGRAAAGMLSAIRGQLLILLRRRRLRELRGQQLELRHQLRLLADEYAQVKPRVTSFT